MGNLNFKYILISFASVTLAIFAGYITGNYFLSSGKPLAKQLAVQIDANTTLKKDPLFSSQNATFEGVITKLNNTTSIEVTNSNNQQGKLMLGKNVVIYKAAEGTNKAIASPDLKFISYNRQATIFLELRDGQYQVLSITYLPAGRQGLPTGNPNQSKP
ncbi:hypothetical protein HYW46_04495 [Candidatus Daviesbacteria bacterium]|nr:hypothetical protein [Candidatus Daviesbacteria bacterium]